MSGALLFACGYAAGALSVVVTLLVVGVFVEVGVRR